MRTAVLFGTFDFLHSGHIRLFEQAKEHADKVVVLLAREAIVERIKGKPPIHTEEERKAILDHIDIIDEVHLGDHETGEYLTMMDLRPDIVVLGYDQHALKDDVERFIDKNNLDIEIVVAQPYKEEQKKSSVIKQALEM